MNSIDRKCRRGTRSFILVSVLFLFVLGGRPVDAAPIAGGSLDPTTITKYVTPLLVPPAMPYTAGTNTDFYEIAVRQFQQQVLPAGFPQTTVWGYGSTNPASIFNFPSLTIEATNNRPVQVKWINDLIDQATGECLPHLLPVDQTLHWANPLGPRDSRGTDNTPYAGPVPIVTHVHGAETNQESDGYPEAWYLPNCNIPGDINFTTGTLYNTFKASSTVGNLWEPGATVFTYPNDQRATTLWYHDHALGMTRLNVYAGPAGFYLLRGGPDDQVGLISGGTATLPGPAPAFGDGGGPYYEIPIAIQERSFNSDGSLFYPDNRAFFEGVDPLDLNIPFIPDLAINGMPSEISPIWNPEFFGNTNVVNGNTWPYLQVEQRRYRFRLLNGNQSRFLILTTDTNNTASNAMTPVLTFWQIGAEGGFLSASTAQTQLLIAPAERADVIVDFTNIPVGTNITLLNIGPDEPFGGGIPYFGCATDPMAPQGCFEPSDINTTGQVMQFQVVAINGTDTSTPPDQLALPARTPLPAHTATRYISLNESMSMSVCVAQDPVTETYVVPIDEVPCTDMNAVLFGPTEAVLGTFDPVTGISTPMLWMDNITETPLLGATEVWEIRNFTEDAHPIHIHQVQFEVLERGVISDPTGTSAAGSNLPLPWETGTKDTVIVYPGEFARVKANFTFPGLFVWHCHIIEHEDNEMMRPYCVANADGTLPTACQIANWDGFVAINAGSASAGSRYVTLTLDAMSGMNMVTNMRFSWDNATWYAWEPFAASRSATLQAGADGLRTIYVQFRDDTAGLSPVYSDSILLETAAPAGSVVINGDAATAGSRYATLTLTATDAASAVTNMRFSWDGATYYGWETYATSRNVTLPAGDGTKTIYAQFRDSAGNVSTPASDGILLDQTGPTGSIMINGGAASTGSRYVALNLDAADALNAVTNMQFSWDGTTWYGWEAYATNRNATIPSATPGTYTIFTRFRDAAGSVSSTYSDSINYAP